MSVPRRALDAWKLLTSKGFDTVLNKVQLVSVSKGNCSAEMKVSEEHTNRIGTLHGGLVCTIVDIVSGVALIAQTEGTVGVSVDLHVSFLKGVKIGEDIVINAKTVKVGKTLAFLDVEVLNKSDGKIVAKGTHTKFIAER